MDLQIRVEEGRLLTSTYFKSTDRNAFIPHDSCHHSSWLDSVPKSQYMRLKHNCTKTEDFRRQANVLTNRFLEKGYSAWALEQRMVEVEQLYRDQLLVERPMRDGGQSKFAWPFIMGHSHQHYLIKKLVYKHWHIIKNDLILGPILPDKPQVVFRGVPSLKHSLAPSACDPPSTRLMFFQNLIGYHKCKKMCRMQDY